MAIDVFQTLGIIEAMENFMERRRPPENIRKELDISYRIEEQSVIVLEIRPRWKQPEEIMELPVAKATFVQLKNLWKVFWQRADLKWHSYPPQPTVKTIQEFIKLVDEDKQGCFWG